MLCKTLLGGLLAATALPCAAQVSWYAGLAGGQSRTDIEAVRNREQTLQLAQTVQTDFDDRDTAWKVFGGVRLNSVIAVELTYADLGRAQTVSRGLGGDPALPYGTTVNRKVTSYGADIVGFVPLVPTRFELLGKAGVYRSRLRASSSVEGNIVFTSDPTATSRSISRTEDTTHLGLGFQWWITRTWGVRAEYERFYSIGKPFAVGGTGTTGQADVDAAWLAVTARF